MIDYPVLEALLRQLNPEYNFSQLRDLIEHALDDSKNGRLKSWKHLVTSLPAFDKVSVDADSSAISIHSADTIPEDRTAALESQLKQLRPWRKGPWDLFGIYIDTEWRSDWKWDRLAPHLPQLRGKTVLDVGCGNGYHCWRSIGKGARLVIGIDPYLLSVVQFYAVKNFTRSLPVFVLPLALGEFPGGGLSFDVVFSMGVLYHCRSPLDHLLDLRALLAPGGTLVLETLVIDEQEGQLLMPENRYAKMRNVWFIPSPSMLEQWLLRSGYRNCRLVDITKTTTEEQRATEWMTFESLSDFLDPEDDGRTIEGYPAPKRTIFLAEVP